MTDPLSDLGQAALKYALRGWNVFPCVKGTKIPAIANGCLGATADPGTIRVWWERFPQANIGLACGPASGVYVVDIDVGVDGKGEPKNGYEWLDAEKAKGNVLPETVRQKTPGDGEHFLFKSEKAPANKNNFRRGVDIRSKGYYIMAAPSLHPDGGNYAWTEGAAPGDIELAEFPNWCRPELDKPVEIPWSQPARPPVRPVDASALEIRASAYLQQCEPAVQGAGGHDALLWAARGMVVGFQLDDATALRLLEQEYNPRCRPPWNLGNPSDAKDFKRKVTQARTSPGKKAPGWLLTEFESNDDKLAELGGKLASGLLASMTAEAAPAAEEPEIPKATGGRKPVPEHLLVPPGMVGEVCKWLNATARKEQPILSLAAALAFCGSIYGRKVCDEWDLRTNIYALGVAQTCAGKEHARSQIKKLLQEVGITERLLGGEDVTSDAAIEERLAKNPTTLYLWDEIGHMISSIKASGGGNPYLAKIVPLLMKMYSSADSVFVGKEYASGERRTIDQPCLCLYGTTVPSNLFKGMTSDELRDGFLGRVLVFSSESDPESDDQRAKRQPIPPAIIEHVRFWWLRKPPHPEGTGDIMAAKAPSCIEVPTSSKAQARFIAFRKYASAQKQHARLKADATEYLWGRAEENARKIALVVASGCSFDGIEITIDHAEYACQLVEWLIECLAENVRDNVADSTIESDKQYLLRIVKAAGPRGLTLSQLGKKSPKFSGRQRTELVDDMVASDTLVRAMKKGKTRPTVRLHVYPYGLTTE